MTVFDTTNPLGEVAVFLALVFFRFTVGFHPWLPKTRGWYESAGKGVPVSLPVWAYTVLWTVVGIFAIAGVFNYAKYQQGAVESFKFDAVIILSAAALLMDVAGAYVFFKLKRLFWHMVIAFLGACCWLVAWALMWVDSVNLPAGLTTVPFVWDLLYFVMAIWWYAVVDESMLDIYEQDIRDELTCKRKAAQATRKDGPVTPGSFSPPVGNNAGDFTIPMLSKPAGRPVNKGNKGR